MMRNALQVYIFTKPSIFIKTHGICEWEYMDYDENNCFRKPTYQAKLNALPFKIEDWKTIYINKYFPIKDIDEVKLQIHRGNPVGIAVWLDSEISKFMKDYTPYKPKFVWRNPLNDLSKNRNYHAMLCVGYDDDKQEFKVLNSYGKHSANNGYVYMSYEAFKNAVYEAYYAVDALNGYTYPLASKRISKNKQVSLLEASSGFNGYLKQGYYVEVTPTLKLSCVFLSKRKDMVVLRLYDTSSNSEKMIGSYRFNSGDTYEVKYKGEKYSIKLEMIKHAGYNPFKSAAFIRFSN